MNLSLSDVLFVGLVIVIVACGLAGLGELRDWLSEGRELDRVRRLAAKDDYPVRREHVPPGIEVVIDPRMERLGNCDWCTPGVPVSVAMPADCTCGRIPCPAPYCGARLRVTERG